MQVWDVIKGVRFRQLKSLLLFLIKHPIFMVSTIIATFDVVRVSQKEFPDTHGFHNKANAFRHALWNIFIAKQCALFSRKSHEVISWTKKFTDWHEDFSPNEELSRIMDLHNNYIGRELFLKTPKSTHKQWVILMKEQLHKAVQIVSVEDVVNYPSQLVYLEN
jgi:hypothetical protein